jgi:hypothetical protein
MRGLLIKITLAFALVFAGLATAASYYGNLRPVATLGSGGGGNLVPLCKPQGPRSSVQFARSTEARCRSGGLFYDVD